MTVSLGSGPSVTGRVTFDKKKAAQGGAILVVPHLGAEDLDALRLADAVVATSGGPLGFIGVTAREYGIPAVILGEGVWDFGGRGDKTILNIEQGILGVSRKAEGFEFRVVEKTIPRRVSEGDVVTVDAARGAVRLYPTEEQEPRLSLSRALRAYDGLKDAQSLVIWHQGRGDAARMRALLGEWLLEELAQRVVSGTAPPVDFSRVRKAVLKDAPAPRGIWERQALLAADFLKETEKSLKAAGLPAARRLGAQAASRWERLKALAPLLGSPDTARLVAAFKRVSEESARRIKHLEEHPMTLRDVVVQAGADVPKSLKISAADYRRFIAENGLEEKINDIASNASLPLRRKSERIGGLIRSGRLPSGLEPLALGGTSFLVVGAQTSLPASRDSFPAVLKEIWSALWNPRNLGQRKRDGRELADEDASVSVQEAVTGEVSGTVLTRDIASGERVQTTMKSADVPAEDLEKISRVASALDAFFGHGLDVRFALSKGKLTIVEVRPLTRENSQDSPASAIILDE